MPARVRVDDAEEIAGRERKSILLAYNDQAFTLRDLRMRSLNRLKWLHAFEATARHGSFTGAAQELGVTPAAVGQLVRSL